MKFSLQHGAMDLMALKSRLADPACGAFAAFEGWVRNENEGRDVLKLEYEAYSALAGIEGATIIDEALEQFDISKAICVHRIGLLQVGDLAVWVGVSSPHRRAAFDACQYIIDETKRRVPIWKKEYYADGEARWVNCVACADDATRSA